VAYSANFVLGSLRFVPLTSCAAPFDSSRLLRARLPSIHPAYFVRGSLPLVLSYQNLGPIHHACRTSVLADSMAKLAIMRSDPGNEKHSHRQSGEDDRFSESPGLISAANRLLKFLAPAGRR
jgi:hypothetical protein